MKPVVRIHNNSVEMITDCLSTKIAKTNLIRQNTWTSGDVADFPYIPIEGHFEPLVLINLKRLTTKAQYVAADRL